MLRSNNDSLNGSFLFRASSPPLYMIEAIREEITRSILMALARETSSNAILMGKKNTAYKGDAFFVREQTKTSTILSESPPASPGWAKQ